jgi:hypothetical protein
MIEGLRDEREMTARVIDAVEREQEEEQEMMGEGNDASQEQAKAA